jgi:hypothetical protein
MVTPLIFAKKGTADAVPFFKQLMLFKQSLTYHQSSFKWLR